MNVLNPILCLFLMGAQIQPTSVETQISQWEEQVEMVDANHVSQLSKEVAEFTQDMDVEAADLQKEIKNNQALLKDFQRSEKIVDKKIGWENSQKNSFWIWKRYRAGKELNRLENQKIRLKKQIKQSQNKITHAKKLIQKIKGWQKRLETIQNKLGFRFQDAFQTIQDQGKAHSDRSIQGQSNLPSYGSVQAPSYKKGFSCLWDGNYQFDGASGMWMPFIKNGTISAGTWSYPSGGMHLGLDVAASMYSPIQAGANGIVLYADAPVPSNCGYLGNYCGWPYGGGNTICTIMAVQDQLYAVTLCHLSNQIYVYPGQQFSQGDILAKSGNSGNSTGPHTHIEVFSLRVSLAEALAYFRKGSDFSFGCGWSAPATCSAIACRVRPEQVF